MSVRAYIVFKPVSEGTNKRKMQKAEKEQPAIDDTHARTHAHTHRVSKQD